MCDRRDVIGAFVRVGVTFPEPFDGVGDRCLKRFDGVAVEKRVIVAASDFANIALGGVVVVNVTAVVLDHRC